MSGKKANSGSDNFQATNLTSYASRLTSVRDSVDQALGAIKAAWTAIKAINTIVDAMHSLAVHAKSTADMTDRSRLAAQFDSLQTQIAPLVEGASYQGINLIGQIADSLTVTFDENATHTLIIAGIALHSKSYAMAANNWKMDHNIEIALVSLNRAITTLQMSAQVLNSNAAVLTVRLNFAQELIDTLEESVSKLVNADINKEAASLLALQTRQQLSTTSLNLAHQLESSVLSLF